MAKLENEEVRSRMNEEKRNLESHKHDKEETGRAYDEIYGLHGYFNGWKGRKAKAAKIINASNGGRGKSWKLLRIEEINNA